LNTIALIMAAAMLPALVAAQVTCGDVTPDCPRPPSPVIAPLPCDCETPGTQGDPCPALRPESYTPAPLVRDPRPVVLVCCFNGDRSGPRMWAPWWNRPDGDLAVYNLIVRLNNCYSRGFRRMVLYLPAGTESRDPEGAVFSSAQYWSLPSGHKRAINTRLRAWIESKERAGDPVSLGVYAGFYVNRDVACLSMHPSEALDVGSADHTRKMFLNVIPWAELGFREYWLDYSATKPCVVGAMQAHPGFVVPRTGEHVRFGGEAIPCVRSASGGDCRIVVDEAGRYTPDAVYLARSPWVCTLPYLRSVYPGREAWGYEADIWRLADGAAGLSPATTDLGLMFIDGREPSAYRATIDDAVRLFRADANARPWTGPWRDDLGWVLWSGHEDIASAEYPAFHRYLEVVQRVYDMGTIRAAADYDADGRVTDHDLEYAKQAVSANRGAPSATYLMGDFDGDGSVTDGDMARFREWWEGALIRKEYASTDLERVGP